MNPLYDEHKTGIELSLSEVSYFVSFGLLLGAKAFGLYDGHPIFRILLVIAAVFFAIKIFSTPVNVWEVLFILLWEIVAGIVYYRTGDKSLILYGVMALGGKRIPVRKIMRFGCIIWCSCFGIMVFLAEFGLWDEIIMVHPKHGIGNVICHALGYSHPNVLHISYVVTCVFIMYCVDQRKMMREIALSSLLLMLGNAVMFANSLSFTGGMLCIAYLGLNFYLQVRSIYMHGSDLSMVERFLIYLVIPLCATFSILGPVYLYGTEIWGKINNILNTRYYLSWWFITSEGIHLWGHRIVTPFARYTMDCSYVFLIVQLGLIPFVLLISGMMMMVYTDVRMKKWDELAIILGFAIAGISEPFLYNASFKNISFLFMGAYVYETLSQHAEKTLQLFKLDNIKIKIPIKSIFFQETKKKSIVESTTKIWVQHVCFIFMIFIIGAVLGGVTYRMTSSLQGMPVMYTRSEWNSDHTYENEFLSEKQVQVLKDNGGIVAGWNGSNTEMTRLSDRTIYFEYILKGMNRAFWSGMIAVLTVLMICKIFDVQGRTT